MQREFGEWPGLKGRLVTRNSSEIVVVEEIKHLLALLDADVFVVCDCVGDHRFASGFVEPIVFVRKAGAGDEDVAVLEFGALFFGTGDEFGDGDLVC